MEVFTGIIGILGVLVMFSSLFIMKYSDKNEEILFREHKDLPDEEFNELREKNVYRPQKWAFFTALAGNVLVIPNALFHLFNQDIILGAIQLGVIAFSISLITITKKKRKNLPAILLLIKIYFFLFFKLIHFWLIRYTIIANIAPHVSISISFWASQISPWLQSTASPVAGSK